MPSATEIQSPELALLAQLLGAATHDASAAMCRWTSGLITLALDEVREVPLESAGEHFAGDELLTMVVHTLDGELGGALILAFDEVNGRELAASLLGKSSPPSGPWSELEKSALCETGNILSCAYMNAITRLIDRPLVPSPPYLIQDFGASVLEQALLAQAATADKALICRTQFSREGRKLNWNVFFVPGAALRQAMEDAFEMRP